MRDAYEEKHMEFGSCYALRITNHSHSPRRSYYEKNMGLCNHSHSLVLNGSGATGHLDTEGGYAHRKRYVGSQRC